MPGYEPATTDGRDYRRGVRPYGSCRSERCLELHALRVIQMLQQGGAIVNTSSPRRRYGIFPGQAAYIACKHAVIGLTRTCHRLLGKRNPAINAVCPGVIRTPMAEELIRRNPDLEKELVRDILPDVSVSRKR